MNRSLTLKEKKQLVLNSDIKLAEQDGNGKGRYFVSRFIEPGIAHYEELGDILITKETLNKFIQTMIGVPVIIDHEDVTDKNVDKLRVGSVSKVWFDEFDGYFYCEGILTDQEAIDLVKNQGWNVSCAYSFVADETKKQHNGKDIDMEFTDGEFLHLAIVKNPRYEGANIVVNSKDKKETVENSNKENIIMQVLNELKEFIKNVVSNEKEEKMEVKNEDKRKLIDEIGGILKDKVDDEIIRTVIKKAEELSYEPSEDDKADNKAKNEEDEEEAKNKCKNEEDKKDEDKKDEKDEKAENEEEESKDVTENEEDEEKEEKTENKKVKNSIKDVVMGGSMEAQETKLYTSRKERLEEGNKY